MYFWVNQGKTYKEEKEGSYLWAPTKNKKGETKFHWLNMTKLKPGDIVFNYRKGFILGYCEILSDFFYSHQPEEFNVDVEWEKEGYMIDAKYILFSHPLDVKTVYNKIKDHLPNKYSPLNINSGANQGYLFECNAKMAQGIFELSSIKYNFKIDHTNELKEKDIENKTPEFTTKLNLTTSRVGQGEFRQKILRRWNYRCAVTKSPIKEILTASHIVPWREATDKERLDVENGLLLSPVYDALFDRYLISFDENGSIIISKTLKTKSISNLGITGKEKIENLTTGNKVYLKIHRQKLINL